MGVLLFASLGLDPRVQLDARLKAEHSKLNFVSVRMLTIPLPLVGRGWGWGAAAENPRE